MIPGCEVCPLPPWETRAGILQPVCTLCRGWCGRSQDWSEPRSQRKHLDPGRAPGILRCLRKERGGTAQARGRERVAELSPQSQRLILTPNHSFIRPSNTRHPSALGTVLGARNTGTETLDPHGSLSPGLEDPRIRQKTISSGLCPHVFPPFLLPPPWALLSFVAGPVPPSACLCSAASRKGLVQAEHGGFGEQSRVWFQHLIQFVLPRLKYEMVASQTFKGRRRESERLLKFEF